MSETTTRPSFLDRQKDAALAMIQEQTAERRRIEQIVLGDNRQRRNVTEVIKLGNDHLVKVVDRDDTARWTFVIDGKANNWYHQEQEDAILHLIAARYDDNPNSNVQAAFYAGRVLGVPSDPSN